MNGSFNLFTLTDKPQCRTKDGMKIAWIGVGLMLVACSSDETADSGGGGDQGGSAAVGGSGGAAGGGGGGGEGGVAGSGGMGGSGGVAGSSGAAGSGATAGSSGAGGTNVGGSGGEPRDYSLRPFSDDSPWNIEIPPNATYLPNDPRTQRIRSFGAFGVNTVNWTIWTWYASDTDPYETIQVSASYVAPQSSNPRPGTVTIRIPTGAHPDSQNDAHFAVIEPNRLISHEFWFTQGSPGNRTAASYAKVPLDGLGVDISRTGSYNPEFETYGWGAGRAYGGSILGGLIRENEATTGPMKHAIAAALPAAAFDGTYVWPATHTDDLEKPTGDIPMGTRFGIPKSVDIDSLPIPTAHKHLGYALQNYGLIIVDKSGSPCLYAEGVAAEPDGKALQSDHEARALLTSLLVVVEFH